MIRLRKLAVFKCMPNLIKMINTFLIKLILHKEIRKSDFCLMKPPKIVFDITCSIENNILHSVHEEKKIRFLPLKFLCPKYILFRTKLTKEKNNLSSQKSSSYLAFNDHFGPSCKISFTFIDLYIPL